MEFVLLIGLLTAVFIWLRTRKRDQERATRLRDFDLLDRPVTAQVTRTLWVRRVNKQKLGESDRYLVDDQGCGVVIGELATDSMSLRHFEVVPASWISLGFPAPLGKVRLAPGRQAGRQVLRCENIDGRVMGFVYEARAMDLAHSWVGYVLHTEPGSHWDVAVVKPDGWIALLPEAY